MADYNTVRSSIGFTPLKSITEICRDRETVSRLTQAYGNINNIDLWTGILSEQPITGGNLGTVAAAIVGETFRRLRAGDRFWYQNSYPQEDI